MNPAIVAVGGFSSNVGKTTLVCELLRVFPGWEAIKLTRGHYRSCGKDPHACCVSHLLSDRPTIYSGLKETYAPGKDTGRYWDAGASNVHWVVATDHQVEEGMKQALARVQAAGVLVEGTSFLKFVRPEFAILVARQGAGKIKPSARQALAGVDAVYLSDDAPAAGRAWFTAWRHQDGHPGLADDFPIYTRADLPQLMARIQGRCAVDGLAGAGLRPDN